MRHQRLAAAFVTTCAIAASLAAIEQVSAAGTCSPTTIDVTTGTDSGQQGELRGALALACPGSTIRVGASAVHLNSPLTIDRAITIVGWHKPGPVTLSNDRLGVSEFDNSTIDTAAAGLVIELRDLTVTHGTGAEGGGIADFNGSNFVLKNVTVTGNHLRAAGAAGGAGVLLNGDLTMTRTDIRGNTAETTTSDPLDIAEGAGAIVHGRIDASASSISDNMLRTFGDGEGGGAYLDGGGRLDHVRVEGNRIEVFGDASGDSLDGKPFALGGGLVSFLRPLEITNATIAHNIARVPLGAASGGGLQVGFRGDVTLRRSQVAFNMATGETAAGGGIHVLDVGSPLPRASLDHTVVIRNQPDNCVGCTNI